MKKIKVDSLLKEEIRAIVPFKTSEGKDEKIVIYNPSESLKQEVINMFYVGIDNPEKKVSENEIIKFLFDKITNIELNMSLDEIKEKEISYELECVLYHVTSIFNEIVTTTYMSTDLQLRNMINDELAKRIDNKVKEVEKVKHLN